MRQKTGMTFSDYLADIRHNALPQSDLLAYVSALCDRTAKAAARFDVTVDFPMPPLP